MKKNLLSAAAICVVALMAADAAYAASGKGRSGTFVSRDSGKASHMMSSNKGHGKSVIHDRGKKHDDRLLGKRDDHKVSHRDKKDDDRHNIKHAKRDDKKESKPHDYKTEHRDEKQDDRPFRYADFN